MDQNKELNNVSESVHSGKEKTVREIFEWVLTFCQALFAVVIVFTFFFRFVTVDGHSMDMTLAHGDRLIISDVGYTPERGDIVVIHDLEAERVMWGSREPAFRGPVIKRVIATEGETVVIDYDNWTIKVTDTDGNTFVLDEPYVNYISNPTTGKYVPIMRPVSTEYPQSVGHLEKHTVEKGCVFVCGDNRSNSLDSRYVGDIEVNKILGKVLFRVLPNPGLPQYIEY